MSNNRAVVVDPTTPGKLHIQEIPLPAPAPNEAVVRVAAISLNPGEVRMTRNPRPNWRPGWDMAGVVERAAADGTGPEAGARVAGILRWGAWAEAVAAPTDQVAKLPDNVTFAQAAALPVAGLTALHCLIKGGFLLERPVLITGATGGVGDYAIQLAKRAGAITVAYVRRPDQEAQVREAGADEVVTGEGLAAARQYGPYALIIDSVGGSVLGEALGLAEEGTRIVSIGASAGKQVTFDAQRFYSVGMASLYGMILFDELRTVENASIGLTRLARLVGHGKLKPRINLETDWTQIDEIAQRLQDRKYSGKAVLHVASI